MVGWERSGRQGCWVNDNMVVRGDMNVEELVVVGRYKELPRASG